MDGEKKIKHWEIISIYLALYDILAINFSYFAGLWLRFDLHYSGIPQEYLSAFLKFAPFYTVFSIIIFMVLRLYNSLWRFASFSELNRILISTAITTVFHILGITIFFRRMPMSYYIIGAVFQFCAVTAVRFLYRFVSLERSRRNKASNALHRAMVIGAGSAGQVIVRDLKSSSKSDIIPVCVIDDNPNKWGRFMDGVPIAGGRDSIMEAVEKYSVDRILFAIPTASAENKRDILNICSETGCTLQSLPGIFQLANGEAHLSNLKPVAVEDLLGRETIKVNMDEIYRHLKGKRVLVTGGGGSIGSELCRQIAAHEPSQLIIFDVDMVIGMRGHAQMIPFGTGCEIITLGSHDKMKWFLEDIDATDWYIDLNRNDCKLDKELLEHFVRIHETEHESTQARLKLQREKLWDITVNNMTCLRSLLKNRDEQNASKKSERR